MQQLIENLVQLLVSDINLNALVPPSQIFVGPVDIATEKQAQLLLPQINIHTIAESFRTVPRNTRDSQFQIDIWSRNSQLEVVQIYELIVGLLTYNEGNQGTAHIFWEKPTACVDFYESDRRIFHRAVTLTAWSIKP